MPGRVASVKLERALRAFRDRVPTLRGQREDAAFGVVMAHAVGLFAQAQVGHGQLAQDVPLQVGIDFAGFCDLERVGQQLNRVLGAPLAKPLERQAGADHCSWQRLLNSLSELALELTHMGVPVVRVLRSADGLTQLQKLLAHVRGRFPLQGRALCSSRRIRLRILKRIRGPALRADQARRRCQEQRGRAAGSEPTH